MTAAHDPENPAPRLHRLDGGNAVVIRGGLRSGTGTVAAILGGAVAIGLLFIALSPRPEAIPHGASLLLASAAALLIAWVAAQLLVTEHVRVDAGAIVYEKYLTGWCWQRSRIPGDAPVEVRVVRQGSARGVMIDGGGQRWLVGRSLDTSGREWLREWLATSAGSL